MNTNHKPGVQESDEDKDSQYSLAEVQKTNETGLHRNVGLVIEPRPDEITPDEIRWLRHLGVTKVQLGAQSLDDRILELNKRGHNVDCTRQVQDRPALDAKPARRHARLGSG